MCVCVCVCMCVGVCTIVHICSGNVIAVFAVMHVKFSIIIRDNMFNDPASLPLLLLPWDAVSRKVATCFNSMT